MAPTTEKENVRERAEIEELERRIAEETPARGSQLQDATSFDALPLSRVSKLGLNKCKFTKPTRIQIGAIPHALAGRDILAAAKTGSGKTLAFLLPVLEKLYRARWDIEDGLGALVISPTRELALQIFEVLRTVGKGHSFSAGLVIGGKNFKEEQLRMVRMNLLVCTPGRLLQHFQQTPNFETSNLQLLVLDEADRILDMGFQTQLRDILSYLPPDRQTMLFSATQTKSIKDLAALSLREPEYIAVHEQSTQATPSGLIQNYVVCDLDKKLDVLFSFIKSHLKQKTIVFLSTCRQVRFVHQAFCRLQPGVPLIALHGKYKQDKRVQVYYDFLNKPAAVLFCTDIAARGLDFPKVDWVFQLDCPEDGASYIHRVGRTARYNKQGKALLCLTPSEKDGMLQELEKTKVPIQHLKMNPAKAMSCREKITSVVASDKDIKALAQKAFMSYVRSVCLQPKKEVFDVSQLPLDDFAQSLGLMGAPRMPFLEKMQSKGHEELRKELRGKKNVNRKLQQLKDKIKKKKEVKPEEPEEEDLMVVKRTHRWDEDVPEAPAPVKKKRKIDTDPVNVNKVVFDDDGKQVKLLERLSARDADDDEDVEESSNRFTAQVAERLRAKEKEDRELERERVRAKHQKKRMKQKGDKAEESDDEGVVLGGGSSDSGDSEGDDSESDSNEEEEEDQEEMALQMLQGQ